MGRPGGFFQRIAQKLQRFMQGRYGTDKLNMLILTVGLVCSLLSMFIPFIPVRLLLFLASYTLMIIALWRTFSRKTYKRYDENRRYLLFLQRMKDRTHRYYDCPRCRQQVRVPKGKGKIAITCPRCKEKFTKKT